MGLDPFGWEKENVEALQDIFTRLEELEKIQHYVIASDLLTWVDYAPSGLTLVTGTSSGTLSQVQTMLDGNVYAIAEVTGTPGFDIIFDFSSLVYHYRWITTRFNYVGSLTHIVEFQIYNYTTTAWDALFSTVGTPSWQTRTVYLPAGISDYVDGSGNARARFIHTSAGNASHDFYVDYVGLSYALQEVSE